ncbi:MAG: TRAP transporter small permease [Paracoccus sp. (in: a-proteobacteria)]|jgi:TRAP-type C4-dicarboxylate transport system permease small subunit
MKPSDMIWPAGFVGGAAWVVWHMPGYLVLTGLAAPNLVAKYPAAGPADLAVLLVTAGLAVAGCASARDAAGPGQNVLDLIAIFLGRVSMVLILLLVGVIGWEVLMRYAFEAPTLWANELSLWITGFVIFLSGIAAQQQRIHIRIDIVHAGLPRRWQRICDLVTALAATVFALGILWGSYNEVSKKFFTWETYGTAFDPPIPATLMALMVVALLLVALQSIVDVIADWRRDPQDAG